MHMPGEIRVPVKKSQTKDSPGHLVGLIGVQGCCHANVEAQLSINGGDGIRHLVLDLRERAPAAAAVSSSCKIQQTRWLGANSDATLGVVECKQGCC
jgi:hypothetical protein